MSQHDVVEFFPSLVDLLFVGVLLSDYARFNKFAHELQSLFLSLDALFFDIFKRHRQVFEHFVADQLHCFYFVDDSQSFKENEQRNVLEAAALNVVLQPFSDDAYLGLGINCIAGAETFELVGFVVHIDNDSIVGHLLLNEDDFFDSFDDEVSLNIVRTLVHLKQLGLGLSEQVALQ